MITNIMILHILTVINCLITGPVSSQLGVSLALGAPAPGMGCRAAALGAAPVGLGDWGVKESNSSDSAVGFVAP